MLRGIAGVVLGYLAMFVVMFVLLTGIYLILGTERAFLPASYTPATLWMVIMVVAAIIAAVVGGLVCAKVASGATAPKVLAVLVFALGLMIAVGTMGASKATDPRPGDLANFDAMMKANTPQWFAFASPLIQAIAVLAGAGMVKRRP